MLSRVTTETANRLCYYGSLKSPEQWPSWTEWRTISGVVYMGYHLKWRLLLWMQLVYILTNQLFCTALLFYRLRPKSLCWICVPAEDSSSRSETSCSRQCRIPIRTGESELCCRVSEFIQLEYSMYDKDIRTWAMSLGLNALERIGNIAYSRSSWCSYMH